MASAFNLTAQINLRGPSNLKPIVADIKRQLGSVSADVKVNLDARSAKSIETVTNRLKSMNSVLVQTRNNAQDLNTAFRNLSTSLSSIQTANNATATSTGKISSNLQRVGKDIKVARTEMEEFGKQSYLAIKRFAAFSFVTTGIFALTNAVTSGLKAFIDFDRELIKLQQVTGKGAIGISSLEKTITNLAISLGVSSDSLIKVASTLAQAGFSAEETRIALTALAKTELAPSFDDLTSTTEGAIAALRQFGLQAKDLEAALGSINAVAAAFAVESSDIITAIQRTGGVFASASKGVSEGKDALNEFIAVFTSVRATTRESAETIATGLRTIFTRIQRAKTIDQLKQFGVNLQDLEGKFVGPYEAVKRLSEALTQLDPRDVRFSTIVEELGGFRQIGKVIPLIQQFATTQQALGVAQRGQNSLTDAQIKAQQSLANQIAKVREQFLALIRDIGKSNTFQALFKIVTGLASGLISLASAFKPILPILAIFGAVKGFSAISQFAGGFFGSMKKGGGAKAVGENVGSTVSGNKERERAEATSKAADATRLNTDAIKNLTSSINSLESTIRSNRGSSLSGGGRVYGFNKGGIVPGYGGGDRIPALLEGGEVVINKKAANTYGRGNLNKLNNYAGGGAASVSARELKSRGKATAFIKNLITDGGKKIDYKNGKAINLDDTISFSRNIYTLDRPDLVNDAYGFEKAVADRVGGSLTSASRGDPSFPIDVTSSSYGPLEARNRLVSTSNNTLLDKLIRYYVENNQSSRLSNRPSTDTISLGKIGVVYNSAKYQPSNARKLSVGGLIQQFMAGGLAEPMSVEEAAKKGRSEILKVLKKRPGGIEATAKEVGTTAAEIYSILGNKNPDTKTKTFQEAILKEYVKTYNRQTGAAQGQITRMGNQGLVFGAAGMFGRAGSTNLDIASDKLSRSAQVRVISGVMQKSVADKLDSLFSTGAESLAQQAANIISGGSTGGNTISNPSAEAAIQGGLLEKAIQILGGPGAVQGQGFDFPNGLQGAASYFGLPENIPTDLKRTLSGPSTIKDNIVTYLKNVMGYASGGTVPAMVSNGETYVSPRMAKKIGYAKLNKMNMADRNGMSNFAGGGMSLIKGPGSGTSDSIGPVSLPVGSFIIREKATKALKLHKNGGRIGKFANGGRLSKEERKRRKEEFMASQRGGVSREEAYTAGALRPDYQSSGPGRGGQSTQVKVDLLSESIVAPIRKEILDRYTQIYAEEKSAIKDFYQKRINSALAAGEEIAPIVSEAQSLIAETKAQLTKVAKLEVSSATATATQQAGAVSVQSMEALKASKDPFYYAKKAADSSSIAAPGMPVINPKIAEEQREYFTRRAEKAGMSASGYRFSLSQQVGQQKFNIEKDRQFAKQETRDIAIGKQRELKGLGATDKAGFQKLLGEGAESKEAQQAQAAISEFSTNLQKIAPSLNPKEIKAAATLLAEGLATTDKSIEELIASTPELSKIFNTTISDTEAMSEAIKRVADSAGISADVLRANISSKQIKQQAFIQSTEGQRFGKLAEFAPGLTEKFSKTRVGKALGAGGDFVSGKGGLLSKGFAGAGGFQGIGAGIAVGTEALKGFLPKSVTSDPNAAGALGALGGAGAGAAAGAQLGSIAGPIGTLVGGVGGAIIGGIQGFFSAKNTAILTNALEKVAKSSGDLDLAFQKLDAEANDANFNNAQKAFGDFIDAGKEIDTMAEAKTGFQSLGDTFSGGVNKVSAGFAEGDISKIVLGGLQTAFGASGGGLLVDYFSAPSDEQRKEAISAKISKGGQQAQAAQKLAETKLKTTSSEDLDKIFDSIKNGTGELNPIVEQYAAGMAASSGKTIEQVRAQAVETSALDAYMQKRKQAGATEEQINKELQTNRDAAIKEGNEYNKVQAEIMVKQAMLARASKELAVASESLLDVYRRTSAYAQRFSDELGSMMDVLSSRNNSLSGQASNMDVSRVNERILGNMSAYSSEEVKAATSGVVSKLGNTPEAQQLGQQAEAAKFIQDRLPGLLRSRGEDSGPDQRAAALEELKQQMSDSLGITADSGPFEQMFKEIETKLASNAETGTLADEISTGGLGEFSKVAEAASKTLQTLAKTYNDALQQSTELQKQYNESIMKANEYNRKAGSIRINAELDLAKALGNSPTLAQLNEPFDFEIKDLTKGLTPGGTTDPTAIASGIIEREKQKTDLEAQKKEFVQTNGAGAESLAGYQELDAAIGENVVAINEGRQALERLANDGTKAANALAKIEEQQRQIEGLGNTFEKVLTAGPEELFKMQANSAALQQAQQGGPEFMKSLRNRQMAFAGLEQDKEFLTPEEYRKQRAGLIRKGLESQGYTGQSMIEKGGIQMTVDDFIKRLEGGVNEEDPAVKAYRDAVNTQVQANQELARLEEMKSINIQEAMLGLQDFLASEFPKILAQAVTDSRTDAETKPKTEPGAKPQPEQEKPKSPEQLARDAQREELNQRKAQVAADQKKADDAKAAQKAEAEKAAQAAETKTTTTTSATQPTYGSTKTAEETPIAVNPKIEEGRLANIAKAEQRVKILTRQSINAGPDGQKTKQLLEEAKQGLSNLKGTGQETIPAPSAPGTKEDFINRLNEQDFLMSSERGTAPLTQEQRNQRADMLEKGLAANGYSTNTSINTGGVQTTVKEILDAIRTGLATTSALSQPTVRPGMTRQESMRQDAIDLRESAQPIVAHQDTIAQPSSLTTMGPVPVTKPQTVSAPPATTTDGETKTATASVTIDPKSLEALSTFNSDFNTHVSNFGKYVTELTTFTFPTIPDKIELNHTVKVDMTGAASISALEKRLQELAISLVMPKIDELRKQTRSATKGAVPPAR